MPPCPLAYSTSISANVLTGSAFPPAVWSSRGCLRNGRSSKALLEEIAGCAEQDVGSHGEQGAYLSHPGSCTREARR